MKVTISRKARLTIEEFADKHGLSMTVSERDTSFKGPFQFYAHFDGAEVKDGVMLSSASGDGATPEEAIINYGKAISEKCLVLNAYRTSRKEIYVPIIIGEQPS